MFSFVWNTLLKVPLLNLLIFFTRILGNNLGLGILAFTVFLQVVLTPLRLPQLRSARKMQEIKPKLDRLKKEHKDDKAKLTTAQMELFRKHGVSPLGGFIPSIVTVLVFIALYRVLLDTLGASNAVDLNTNLYFSFLKFGEGVTLNNSFLWLDLTKPDPLFILPVIVGASQWLMGRMNQMIPAKKEGASKESGAEELTANIQKQMQYILPAMGALITLRLPAGVGLYWTLSVVFGILQQKLAK